MKILHMADVHLGVKNSKLPSDKQLLMKSEMTNDMSRLFELATKEEYDVVLICGDLFHSKNVSQTLQNNFFDAVSKFNSKVIYTKGNHDEKLISKNLPSNFIILDDENCCCDLGDVVIWGGDCLETLGKSFDENKINILMLHGNIETQVDNDYVDISPYLKFHFQYVAMGHIHTFKSFNLYNIPFVYSGSLFSNGFDETGDKGYVKVVAGNGVVNFDFCPFAKRRYMQIFVDISDCKNSYDMQRNVAKALIEAGVKTSDLVKVVLTGYFEEDCEKNLDLIEESFSNYFYFTIEDKSRLKIDIDKLKKETLSFKCEFISIVEEDQTLSEEEKSKICLLGIEALKGEDLSV